MSIGVFVLLVVGDMYEFLSGQRLGQSIVSAGRQVVQASLQTLQQQHQNRNQQNAEANEAAVESSAGANQRPPGNASSTEYLVLNWLESTFAWFQVVILWHDPFLSLCTLTGLISSLLLLTYLAPRFYATLMIALFTYNLTKVWFKHVWPEIRVPPEDEDVQRADVNRWTYLHPDVMTLKEFGQVTRNLRLLLEFYLKKMIILRHKRPVAFCSIICSTLSCTAYLGHRVDGLTLVFSSMILLVLAPGIYMHLLPNEVKKYLWKTIGLKIINDLNESRLEQGETPIEVAIEALESKTVEEDEQHKRQPSSSFPTPDSTLSLLTSSTTTPTTKSLFDLLKERSMSLYRRSSSTESSEKTSSAVADTNKEANEEQDGDSEPLLSLPKERSNPINLYPRPTSTLFNEPVQTERSDDTTSSSNDESHSLIDLEEEDQQHDGFVLLG